MSHFKVHVQIASMASASRDKTRGNKRQLKQVVWWRNPMWQNMLKGRHRQTTEWNNWGHDNPQAVHHSHKVAKLDCGMPGVTDPLNTRWKWTWELKIDMPKQDLAQSWRILVNKRGFATEHLEGWRLIVHMKYTINCSIAFYAYYKNAELLSVNHLHASLGSVIVTII